VLLAPRCVYLAYRVKLISIIAWHPPLRQVDPQARRNQTSSTYEHFLKTHGTLSCRRKAVKFLIISKEMWRVTHCHQTVLKSLTNFHISVSFIHQWLYSPLLGPGLFFSFVIIFTQTIGLLGRVISLLQGLYLHTGQHKHRINAHTDIHALNGIRINDHSFRSSEDSTCLRPLGYRDRLIMLTLVVNIVNIVLCSVKANCLERGINVAI
jgi:hypothetical protein